MSELTVEALKALEPGEKLTPGNAVHVRRNLKGAKISVTLRVKRDGKQHDLKAGEFTPPFTKATLLAISKTLDAARENADARIAQKAERKPQAVAVEGAIAKPGAVTKGSTLAQVWGAFLVEVKRNKKWTERNMEANEVRASAHFAKKDPSWAPWHRPASELTSEDIKDLIAPLRATVPHQAKKLCGLLRLALTFAKTRGIAISALLVDHALEEMQVTAKAVPKARNHPALTDITKLRKLYRDIDTLSGSVYVRAVLKLQALTCVRTGEVIGAQWDEFDLDAAVPTWTIPRSRMKVKDRDYDHVIHLPDAAVQLLRSLPRGKDAFVFPGRPGEDRRAPHISDNAVSQAMRRDLGMEGLHVPHGWRSSLRTLAVRTGADGKPHCEPQWVEAVLDHKTPNAVEGAYDRGGHFAEAGVVLKWWAEQLRA